MSSQYDYNRQQKFKQEGDRTIFMIPLCSACVDLNIEFTDLVAPAKNSNQANNGTQGKKRKGYY
jgi:hypothetical protein